MHSSTRRVFLSGLVVFNETVCPFNSSNKNRSQSIASANTVFVGPTASKITGTLLHHCVLLILVLTTWESPNSNSLTHLLHENGVRPHSNDCSASLNNLNYVPFNSSTLLFPNSFEEQNEIFPLIQMMRSRYTC